MEEASATHKLVFQPSTHATVKRRHRHIARGRTGLVTAEELTQVHTVHGAAGEPEELYHDRQQWSSRESGSIGDLRDVH